MQIQRLDLNGSPARILEIGISVPHLDESYVYQKWKSIVSDLDPLLGEEVRING